MRQRTQLSVAVAATLGLVAESAEAAIYTAVLKQVAVWNSSGSYSGNITSSSATWSYDDATGLLSQTGGTFNVRFTVTPNTTLFRHSITGLVIGNGGAATASSYTCTEGNFGVTVGAGLCGNYNFGANQTNESTVAWGPGTLTSRTLGGDDGALGPTQSLNSPPGSGGGGYGGFTTVSWVGTTLRLSNAYCNPFAPGIPNGCAIQGGANVGQTWTLEAGPQVVPVPAAAWLFGSALGVLGYARRKTTQSGGGKS